MSKEQTPMEELLSIVEELKSKGQEVDTNGLEDWINSVGLGKEKEHTQAKVLEALEREVNTAFRKGGESMADFLTGSARIENYTNLKNTYYETEVKPKYQYKDERKNL